MTRNKKIAIIAVGAVLTLAGAGSFIAYNSLFGAPQKQAEAERFTIAIGKDVSNEVTKQLMAQEFIKSELGFRIALFGLKGVTTRIRCIDCITAGAYKISKAMNVWEIAKILQEEPYMKWVVIPEGLRKEQIAEILAEELGWTDQQKSDWVIKFTAMKYDYVEGVYFPDTYLIPKDEEPLQVADRLRAKFNEKFQPYADKFLKANIKWTTALKIASIVQREAAGKDDMPLIAGILWNRLLKEIKLEVDATVQYARDDKIHFKDGICQDPEITAREKGYCSTAEYISEDDWWKPITLADKEIDSSYNTYLYKGLPPHPICNPGVEAIDAVLNSAETECLYYLHDPNRQIHCAKTYEEHSENIIKYLQPHKEPGASIELPTESPEIVPAP